MKARLKENLRKQCPQQVKRKQQNTALTHSES